MLRYAVLFCLIALGAVAIFAQEMPKSKALYTIRPGDEPLGNDGLRALMSYSVDRITGLGAWQPPKDDPAKITSADYLVALKPNLEYCLRAYAQEPATPKPYAYEAIPTFAAFYKGTHDPKYAELTLRATREYCLAVDEEVKATMAGIAKNGGRPGAGLYWTYTYAYVLEALWAIEGTPQAAEMRALLGKSWGDRANAYPLYWERGPQNRSVDVAFWYDAALMLNPNIPRAKELKAYADMVWNDYWTQKDMEEDCAHYTWMDLLTVDAWCRVRGVDWTKDADARNFWISYAEQAAQDGTWPAYGDAGEHGNYFVGLTIEELAAARVRDGRYAWFAHRMFWLGRDRIAEMCAGIGYMRYVELALAYLYSDDTVKEIPPKVGVSLTVRRFRERTNWRAFWGNPNGGLFFQLTPRWQPSKLIFRAGSKEADQFLLLQAGNQAGHGHPDTGSIILYNGGLSQYVANGASRMDDDMELHNLFVVRDATTNHRWYAHQLASEETRVPVMGSASDASYARLHIQEFPGNTPTPEAWQKLYDRWSKVDKNIWIYGDFPPEKAVGYKNWPVRLDRCVLFVNNKFTVVRDVANWILPANTEMGQNWLAGNIGPAIGHNWANVWIPKLYGFYYTNPPHAPVDFVPGDLLVWFAPRPDAVLQIEDGPTNSWYGNYYLNLTRRVCYPRTGTWQPGQPQAFTTVLLPHAPTDAPEKLAATIRALRDDNDASVLQVTDGDTTRILVLNTSGKPVAAGPLTTDAEAAVLTLVKGKPMHLSAWQATRARVGRYAHAAKTPGHLDVAVK